MKTNAIIRIIVWSLVLLILINILGGFLIRGFYLDNYSIFSPKSGAHPTEETFAPDVPLSNEEILSIDPASIRELEIEWAAGDILIQTDDVEQITIQESDVDDEKHTMVYSINRQKLTVRYRKEPVRVGIGASINAEISKDLYITVPNDWNCENLEIDAAAASVKMNNMTIREVDFDGASGTFTINNCNIRALDIDTASADVHFSGTLDTLDFDAASASFIAVLYNTPNRMDMDGMSGSLDLTLPEDCGYSVTMDGISSHFSTDFKETTFRNDAHIYGNGSCRIDVDGMSCDVIIRKATSGCTEPGCTVSEPHTHGTTEETFSREALS